MLKLNEIVPEGAIVPQLVSAERDQVVGELIDALVRGGAATPEVRDELVARVLERERKGSTGFGRGVAVPHVKHKTIRKMAAAIGLNTRGIEFSALDRQPVYSVVLLLSPEDRPEEHLQAMEVIFKNLSKDTFRRFLRQASTVQEVRTLLEEADGQSLGA
ncbi:MAG: PTS sugar transporter subunit IIA [Phycisphaerales bacterium]|nr:PTS sugar transporter subunit IIA [Phycisphaerales bacterium]